MTSSPAGEKRQCAATNARGRQCGKSALPGEDYCAIHLAMEEKKSAPEPAEKMPPPQTDDLEEGMPSGEAIKSFRQALKLLARRRKGDYEVDDWGLDEDVLEQIRPVARWIYHKYWRVEVSGVENVPAEGRGLLVANHSGVLPWDGAMVVMAIQEEHPNPRLARPLVLSLAFSLPFTASIISKAGGVQALPANSERLLNDDQLSLVFPEGVKGIGKPWRRRYQLARFGRGGFVRVALNTQSPIIPVSIVGAEEIYPNLSNFKALASMLRVPYFPVTPTFPWFGPLGLVPLPTKWYIHFDAPIQIPELDYRKSEEPLLVSKISNQVRDTIQRNIYERLKKRRNVFW